MGVLRKSLQPISLIGVVAACAALAGAAAAQPADPANSINLGLTPAPSPEAGLGPAAAETALPARPALNMMNEGVAALVNDDVISSYDLRQRMRLLVATTGVRPTSDNIPQIEQEALRGLVDERLEMQEIKAIETKQKDLKLEATDSEVDETIGDMAKQAGISRLQLLSTLKTDGVDVATLREQIRAQMSWNHYIGARFRDSVAIGDNQVNTALEQANAASLKPQYEMAEIFIDASHVGGQQAAEDGARQLIVQIQQGAPFGAVARQFSALPTAATGGDTGWLTENEISPEIRDALQQMRPGQLSQPIPVSNGVYIVLLKNKRTGSGALVVDLKQVAISLPADAPADQVSKAEAKLNALHHRISGCDTLEAQAAKAPGVVAGDLGETEVKDLRPSFQQAIADLKVNELSPPIRTDVGLHLIAVCGRHASGVAAVTRSDITDRLRGEQLSMFARRFLRDLRNSAAIETR